MDKSEILKNKVDAIRDEVIKVTTRNKAGHIAPSLSCVDILVALYYDVMSYKPENSVWEGRDRLIFSKAHGCYALYAILADKGVMPKDEWESFYKKESSLLGCMERKLEYGLEAGCGSLGHGLPMAVGVAFGALIKGSEYHTFCVVGDGELQEGSAWEALQFAVKHEVQNLTLIIDRNRLQAMDFIVNVLDRDEDVLMKRLEGFGLTPVVCPGHDVVQLVDCMKGIRLSITNMPKVIVAETVKGSGMKCMENVPKFHFRIPACG
ncbi:MAG: transketolase [Planctomycetes bacterium]|nr:transketolase [Planctomycetota bacterium]